MTEQAVVIAEEKIRRYLLHRYPGLQEKGLANGDALVGVLDSLAVLGLIGFIEPEFSIELSPSDVTDENFASVAAITQLVERLSRSAG
jgi:acyl carrier protein